MKNALKLYLVTDRELSQVRSLENVVSEAVKGGVTMVQLREKNASTGEFLDLAFRLKNILKPCGVPLIINDRVDIALAADADGLHIGQSDMPYEVARRLLGPDKIIGLSVENMEDLVRANELDVDYVGISPVYGTPTKTDTARPFGLEGLREAVKVSAHPVVAIGGMNPGTIADVICAGADGVAVVSAICSAESPRMAAMELADVIDIARQADNDPSMSGNVRALDYHTGSEQVLGSRGEFGFIEYIRNRFSVPAGMLGIGDDCAIMPCGEGEIIYTTDMLFEGVHFLRNAASPEDIGWKSLAVNLSDIASMGGVPEATFLSIALPKDARGDWAERFIDGYAELSDKFGVTLLGGDTTSSLRDIVINVGVIGRIPKGKAIKRSGAKPGHGIYVTDNLGDSAAGLKAILNNWERTPGVESLILSHLKPMPRLKEGHALMKTGVVGAMMDVSDGIASDLRHILKASGVGAEIALDKIPVSGHLKDICKRFDQDPYALAIGGGEDYELLFTAPSDIEGMVDFPVYRIGEIVPGDALVWRKNGRNVEMDVVGYRHF